MSVDKRRGDRMSDENKDEQPLVKTGIKSQIHFNAISDLVITSVYSTYPVSYNWFSYMSNLIYYIITLQ